MGHLFGGVILFLSLITASAADPAPPAPRLIPLDGSVIIDTALRLDTEQDNTDGRTRTQFFVVCERHIVTYNVDGKSYKITNMIPTETYLKRIVSIDSRKMTGVTNTPPIPKP